MQRIFVGDIQGCADELEEILARARREFGNAYELWSVGDVVNRGPHSHRALARVREHVEAGRGQLVLGNHELALLGRWLGTRSAGPLDSLEDLLERPDLDEWCEWLRRRPLPVAGELGARRFVMVHAAVAPQWSPAETRAAAEAAAARLAAGERGALAGALRERDDRLGRLVSCRSVRPDGSGSHLPPARLPGAEPWHAAWTRAGHDYAVVYGHWSQQGLHPLSLIDPSGYSWLSKKWRNLKKWWKKYGKQVIAAAVAICATVMFGPAGTGFWAAVGKGALAGAVYGGTLAALNGGGFRDVLTSALVGGIAGGIAAGVGYGMGQLFRGPGVGEGIGAGEVRIAPGTTEVCC